MSCGEGGSLGPRAPLVGHCVGRDKLNKKLQSSLCDIKENSVLMGSWGHHVMHNVRVNFYVSDTLFGV